MKGIAAFVGLVAVVFALNWAYDCFFGSNVTKAYIDQKTEELRAEISETKAMIAECSADVRKNGAKLDSLNCKVDSLNTELHRIGANIDTIKTIATQPTATGFRLF